MPLPSSPRATVQTGAFRQRIPAPPSKNQALDSTWYTTPRRLRRILDLQTAALYAHVSERVESLLLETENQSLF